MGSGIQKKINKSALERIGNVEADIVKLVQALTNSFTVVDTRQAQTDEKIEVLIGMAGTEAFAEKLASLRAQKSAERKAKAVSALDAAVEAGSIVESLTIGEKSLIVTDEYDKDGNLLEGNYSQVSFESIEPHYQPLLLGKGPGESIESKNGGEIRILRVFEFVQPSDEPVAQGSGNTTPVEGTDASQPSVSN